MKISRRELLKLLAASTLTSIFFVSFPEALAKIYGGKHRPLRPPGVESEEDFTAECIRCGACISVCPTKALKPAGPKYGVRALGTPVIEDSYCKIYCLKCIEVCPVRALKPVDPDNVKLADAYIDMGKCILCRRCYDACPLHAVKGRENGDLYIDNDLCKGCNLCKIICPVDAIEVSPIT